MKLAAAPVVVAEKDIAWGGPRKGRFYGCRVWYVAAIYRKRIVYQCFDIDDKPEVVMPLWRLWAVHHFTLPIK